VSAHVLEIGFCLFGGTKENLVAFVKDSGLVELVKRADSLSLSHFYFATASLYIHRVHLVDIISSKPPSQPCQRGQALLLRALHGAECCHHIEILMHHQRGCMLRRNDQLFDERFAVSWVHSVPQVGKYRMAEVVVPIAQDAA
jgi:hypothetical protein